MSEVRTFPVRAFAQWVDSKYGLQIHSFRSGNCKEGIMMSLTRSNARPVDWPWKDVIQVLAGKNILIVEKDEASLMLLKAIVQSIDQDIAIQQVASLRDAKALLVSLAPIDMLVLGLSTAGSRARLGFLAAVRKSHPKIQVLLVKGTKNAEAQSRKKRGDKLQSRYISFYLEIDQCRKAIEHLLNHPQQ